MKTSKIDIEIARMDNDYNIHLIINANIKKRNLRLLIDTGATHSCIAKHIADNMVELETEDVDKLLDGAVMDLCVTEYRVCKWRIFI